jgi:hypothetical protein
MVERAMPSYRADRMRCRSHDATKTPDPLRLFCSPANNIEEVMAMDFYASRE